MLPPGKKAKLLSSLKEYKKTFLDKNLTELDESGTRLMINNFLSQVLGYLPIEEIKTEYMIKGTYADYVVQINSIRHFLVEVKALSFQLSEKHLRQTVNYGANEGIDWALLTNGKSFDFYKILFTKPIESKKIFSIDLSDGNLKKHIELIQYLHKESVIRKGLKFLWNKCEAVSPANIASMLYSEPVINLIKKMIKNKYEERCDEEEILKAINIIVADKIDPATIKPFKTARTERPVKRISVAQSAESVPMVTDEPLTNGEEIIN